MEAGGGRDERPPPPPPEEAKKVAESGGENNGSGEKPKRKMKSPYQLEVLEQTYAVDTYPSEAIRAELSAKIGLTDRQLQMWFCHRRLKDRKFPTTKRVKNDEVPIPPLPAGPTGEVVMAGSSSGSPFSGSGEPRIGQRVAVRADPAVSRMGMGKSYYEDAPMAAPPMPARQLSMVELRVIASVEAQLGEPLREDGPILGVEFEPLPPGAFGAPIAMTPHQKQPMRSYNSQMFERHEAKAIKTSTFLPSMEHSYVPSSSSGKRKRDIGGSHVVHPQADSRALHEYQFLPEQPSIKSEKYERLPQTHFYDSSVVTSNTRVSSLPAGGQYMHGNEQVAPTYTFQGQLPSTGVLPQQIRQRNFSSSPAEYESAHHSNSLNNSGTDAQLGMHQVLGSEDEPSREERKRKSEEARIQKEVEAHEKRIRKELEKQDILRKKREEHMRREMERHDRERRKEEERILREKQREEERFLREQKREIERREKFLQKETRRVEKMRQKEELRREKEAARLKAANERATARRIAKEYMELIDDERLELMELAASNKGLSSITSLDGETLQHLDMFRDMLSAFPPKSLHLKRPFAIQPWTRSEENIANFLMAWKFLITFTDILGLWPFSMDEFLQSLHDYDSKLLGEIHVALLKSIIKDIEDVARTPATALGANQNSAANPGGGHPQIVEGAFEWGFDIRNWQRHLNFLTWPEILRQVALSAGFGPQLKKRTVQRMYYLDDNEGNNGEDVISTLRNGAAAENAVALMHEKGYSQGRRSRHRLTPGTVKFAAYHVLSLEGSKGLTILEVAEKIQKSGLRDLRTSKTPEASIAAALSRDTKLFERTAPSTYCVRAPYRKDPAETDAILSAAREKIQVFQNGLSDSEGAGKDVDDADDAERDEDSEGDGADDPEVEDVSSDIKLSKNIISSKGLKDSRELTSLENEKCEVLYDGVAGIPRNSMMNEDKTSAQLDISPNCQAASNADVQDPEIDESNFGEPWVQGLTNGDYSNLSVEQRLNALVALIGVAIEGNSIRFILEERLDAANALKKQMWAEAQLDKRRFKGEYLSRVQPASFMGSKAEVSETNVAAEGSQTPQDFMNTKDNDGNPVSVANDQSNMSSERNLSGQECYTNPDSVPLQQYGYAEKPRSELKAYIGHKAEQHYEYRSLPLGEDRRRNRYWIFSISASPNEASSGRIFFESKDGLWRLIDTEEAFDALVAALDTRGIRESHLHSMLQRIEPTFKEAIRRNKKHANPATPDGFPVRIETGASDISRITSSPVVSSSSSLCVTSSDSLVRSSSFKIESGRSDIEKNAISKRYKVLFRWMWKECYNPSTLCAMKNAKKRCPVLLQTCHLCYQVYFTEEKHCPSCHKTFKPMYNGDAKFLEHLSRCEAKQKMDPDWVYDVPDPSPIGMQLLKAHLTLMEALVPAEALQPFWTYGYRKSWGMKLHSASSAEDMLQLVTLLEGAIKRVFLSVNFETTTEILGSSTSGSVIENNTAISATIPVLPWVPNSIAAVASRVLDLDASIFYSGLQILESNKEKEAGDFIKPPPRFTTVKYIHEPETSEIPEQIDYQGEPSWLSRPRRGRGRGTRGGARGSRGRGRGGRPPKAISISASLDYNQVNILNYEKSTRKYTKRGGSRTRGRGRGRKRGSWGRFSVMPMQQPDEQQIEVRNLSYFGKFGDVSVSNNQESSEESQRSLGGNENNHYVEEEGNSSGSESDENEYDDQGNNYVIDYTGQNKPMGMMDDDLDEDDEEDIDGYEVEDSGARMGRRAMDVDVDDEDDEEIGDELGGDVNGDNGDEDDYSSEYSDD